MFMLTKGELWSLLNMLREIRDGSETSDLQSDALDLIDMLEAILDNENATII